MNENSEELNSFLFEKSKLLATLSKEVSPSLVGNILKKPIDVNTFIPRIGLFASEYSIGYCFNLHKKIVKK
jgi:hypothetical protein